VRWLILAFLIGYSAIAQDLDVALGRNSARGMTILDQVENRQERAAFEDILQETDPLARRSKVTLFLRDHPQSWLLAQVYEAGARACFDLGDSATGLYYARQSLRLYPENPLLTATLAAVLANRGETQKGRRHALATLELLNRFLPPAGRSEREWSLVRERLTKTALQVAGDAPPPGPSMPKEPKTAFAGSTACKGCHAPQWSAWADSGMSKMLRKVDPAAVVGDFLTTAGSPDIRPAARDSQYFFDLRRANGMWDRYRVDYLIGSKWQQAYATRTPDGDLHVIPLQYNRLEKAWINYWRMIDPPGSSRSEVADFHRIREVTSYRQNCAPCHTSQLEERGFQEPGVNCEMCHGPSAAHAKGAKPLWRFKEVNNREYVEVCAQCHAQSAIREPQGFPPRYQRRPYAEFSRKAFYRDGRFRETTFIVEAFERSACFRKGKAHCGHCHDPHPPDAPVNPVSLKYRDDPDRMCLQCHAADYAGRSHTRHAAGEASRCVACHMPKIMNALLFKARNHQIDDRPDADFTLRFGIQESPNACLDCHRDQSAGWAKNHLLKWPRLSGNAKVE
jgi:hypothetical protein